MTRKQKGNGEDGAWHLDKRVPIAMILAILVQTGGIVWWGATTSERLNALERNVAAASTQPERLAKVEGRLESVQEGIRDIQAILRARK